MLTPNALKTHVIWAKLIFNETHPLGEIPDSKDISNKTTYTPEQNEAPPNHTRTVGCLALEIKIVPVFIVQ